MIAAALLLGVVDLSAAALSQTVTSLSAGSYHACASLSNGTALCWGYNGNGQLGDNTTTDSTVPVTVQNIGRVLSVVAGYIHTCAVVADHRSNVGAIIPMDN